MTNLARPLIALALMLVAVPAAAQPRTDLAPHKAIYNIKMTAKSSASPVLNIGGEMFFEMKAGCEAWTTDHRFNLNYEYADSPPMMVTSDFTTYEAYKGGTLVFNARRKRNGELFEEVRGRAEIAPGKEGAALFTMPDGMRYNLPVGTLYPMAHTAQLRDHVAAGKTFFAATIFDGSNEDGPVEISAFIGRPVDAAALIKPGPEIDADLIAAPARRLRMGFFPLSKSESSPDYEMTALFHDNGIISDMVVEYKEFTVHQTLKALEKQPPEDCVPGKAAPEGKDTEKTRKKPRR